MEFQGAFRGPEIFFLILKRQPNWPMPTINKDTCHFIFEVFIKIGDIPRTLTNE